ncbi:MAG: hypothetical protein KF860_12395 [Cyclobacteriaceae bacterium]|nr:hypothetical protein [Cyclobacteriaceae bacterium]
MSRSVFFLLCTAPFLWNCTGSTNSTSSIDTAAVDSIQSEEPVALDISSPQKLIDSFVTEMKKLNSESPDYTVNGNTVWSNEKISAINFSESFGSSNYSYALLLNPSSQTKETPDGIAGDRLIFFNKQFGLDFSFYQGSLELVADLDNNGQPDFLLNNQANTRNYTQGRVRILLNEGHYLSEGEVGAFSDFEDGVCEGSIGIYEELIVDNETRSVVVSHTEGKRESDCADYIAIKYTKHYQWDKDINSFRLSGVEFPGLINNPVFSALPKGWTQLWEDDNEWVRGEVSDSIKSRYIGDGDYTDYYTWDYKGMNDMGFYLIVDCKDLGGGNYLVITKSFNSSPTIESLLEGENEENGLHYETISTIDAEIGLFTINGIRYTSKPDRFKFVTMYEEI